MGWYVKITSKISSIHASSSVSSQKKNTLHEWKKRFLFPCCFYPWTLHKNKSNKTTEKAIIIEHRHQGFEDSEIGFFVTMSKKPSVFPKKKNKQTACVHRKFARQKPSTSNDVIEHNNKYHLTIGPLPKGDVQGHLEEFWKPRFFSKGALVWSQNRNM